MSDCYTDARAEGSIALVPIVTDTLQDWLTGQREFLRTWVATTHFEAKPNTWCSVPDANGRVERVLVGVDSGEPHWAIAGGPGKLPPGDYHLACDWPEADRRRAAIGWGLGAYRFSRYKDPGRPVPSLSLADIADPADVRAEVKAVTLVRDLINTPAEDMMPEHLAEAARGLAVNHGAEFSEIVGDALLTQGYPLVHAVGRASSHAPRVIELRWGAEHDPRLTLVGKGVCFDSGGLDIKPASGMRLMKKDMGGAAHALGLADLIMASRLPVRLRVLVGAAENAVAGNAFRPGDVLRSRRGLTIEVDNTDAEGRLVICDLLGEASGEKPDLLIDFATLTGAARVAVGTEIAAFFTDDEAAAAAVMTHAAAHHDPAWRLPLHVPYRAELDSRIADILNSASGPAGAITAALFLKEFVETGVPWVHFDIMAWNTRSRPGRPKGGEAMGLRAVFGWLRAKYQG